jgi:high-affinity K+ transport system ATPase subunit B
LSKPFRSDKRKKELQRLKKQEEKRLRRFGLIKEEGNGVAEGEATEGESEVMETGSDVPESAISGETSSEDRQSETT